MEVAHSESKRGFQLCTLIPLISSGISNTTIVAVNYFGVSFFVF